MQHTAPTILVVEDNPATRYAVGRTLVKAGFNVLETDSGEDALKLANQASALIVDLNLPDLHGVAVCDWVKKRSQKPVILMSAVYFDPVQQEAAAQAGADLFMPSPIDPDQLISVLGSLVAADRCVMPDSQKDSVDPTGHKVDDALLALTLANAELALAEEVYNAAKKTKGHLSVVPILKLRVSVLREARELRLQEYIAALSTHKPGTGSGQTTGTDC